MLAVRMAGLAGGVRQVVSARPDQPDRPRLMTAESAGAIVTAAETALARRVPLVVWLASAGPGLNEGVAALDAWGQAAHALARCSGIVPVAAIVDGPLISGPALLLGLVDLVVMTEPALVYVSGPAAVEELTGIPVAPDELGGSAVHSTRSGLASLLAADGAEAEQLVDEWLSYLPDHCDELPARTPTADPVERVAPQLRALIPDRASGSYDVREVISAVADDGEVLELKADWAPQLVTALVRIGGHPVAVLANQPQSMSGTLDIAASQKGARFVGFADAFNLPLLTMVDTSGFMPGRDLEWRGIIRHGAQLVYAYAEATVPRVCLVLRKAYGGAYIVMDSKGMGNDFCLAWPSAELAVMGADGAVSILHRRADPEKKSRLAEDYRTRYLNPYIAAERGYVDDVIDPAQTRPAVARCLAVLRSKREALVDRKHGNNPL
ncbi:MAG TPA: carboxyl transferase domain-containing protein [Acidimicrobiales bacterium]|nr:carboxyl transferase domain-containing protein [Acidimicrobiales bacterium]